MQWRSALRCYDGNWRPACVSRINDTVSDYGLLIILVSSSLAEFTLGASDGNDWYDVSLVDGFNVPVEITNNQGYVDSVNTTECVLTIISLFADAQWLHVPLICKQTQGVPFPSDLTRPPFFYQQS